MEKCIRIQAEPLQPLPGIEAVYAGRPSVGGVVSFIGLMRDINQGDKIEAMTLEHYPGMTEKALEAIVDEAAQRWNIDSVQVVHRVGRLEPLDPIVLVAVASTHRGEAFRACEFIIDYLKTRAPFWKREEIVDGGARWVDARHSDALSAAAWDGGADGMQAGQQGSKGLD
jgi:molybdopterin synthase catalytic subunit